MYYALSSGCPFTPFTFTIQPIHRCHSLRVFVHGAGDFEGCITLSGRFRWLSEVSGFDLFSLMSSPAPPTMHQHDDSRVTRTTLPAAYYVTYAALENALGVRVRVRVSIFLFCSCSRSPSPFFASGPPPVSLRSAREHVVVGVGGPSGELTNSAIKACLGSQQ